MGSVFSIEYDTCSLEYDLSLGILMVCCKYESDRNWDDLNESDRLLFRNLTPGEAIEDMPMDMYCKMGF